MSAIVLFILFLSIGERTHCQTTPTGVEQASNISSKEKYNQIWTKHKGNSLGKDNGTEGLFVGNNQSQIIDITSVVKKVFFRALENTNVTAVHESYKKVVKVINLLLSQIDIFIQLLDMGVKQNGNNIGIEAAAEDVWKTIGNLGKLMRNMMPTETLDDVAFMNNVYKTGASVIEDLWITIENIARILAASLAHSIADPLVSDHTLPCQPCPKNITIVPQNKSESSDINGGIAGPYGPNSQSRITELALLIKNGKFRALEHNLTSLHPPPYQDAVNVLNSLFSQINIFLESVDMGVRQNGNRIEVVAEDIAETIKNLDSLTQNMKNKSADHAQFITYAGKARSSAIDGLSSTVDSVAGTLAYTVARTIGIDQQSSGSCAGNHTTIVSPMNKSESSDINGDIMGPYGANRHSRIVELALVIDHGIYKALNDNLTAIHHRYKRVVNELNSLTQQVNVFIALVHLEVWKDGNKVDVVRDGLKTYYNFENYAKDLLQDDHIDAVHLVSNVIDGGKSNNGGMCSSAFGVVSGSLDNIVDVVYSLVQVIGFNIGIINRPAGSPDHWMVCKRELRNWAWCPGILETIARLLGDRNNLTCLNDKPSKLFDEPTCGNGFLENGEDCDCGLSEECNVRFCDPKTCRVK